MKQTSAFFVHALKETQQGQVSTNPIIQTCRTKYCLVCNLLRDRFITFKNRITSKVTAVEVTEGGHR